MKTLALALLVLIFSNTLMADHVFRIEVGDDYKSYSDSDLKRRVWELERAVAQLQNRIYQLEGKPAAAAADTWLCTIQAMGNSYTGTGASKAVATSKAMENCKAARSGDGFFCKDAKCEQ